MKSNQMAGALRCLVPVAQQADSTSARMLAQMADVFEQCGSQPVSRVVQKIAKHLGSGPDSRSFAIELMKHVSDALQASGSASLSKDYAAVAYLLASFGSTSHAGIFETATSALKPPAKQKKSTPAPIDVREIADRLTASSSDNAAFDALVRGLSTASKPTITKIAAIFLGYERSYKTKAEALAAIRSRQLQDAIEGSRERRISKIAV